MRAHRILIERRLSFSGIATELQHAASYSNDDLEAVPNAPLESRGNVGNFKE